MPVAVCGELAGDPKLCRLLLGMGLRQFSMHPSQLLEVKQQIVMADTEQLEAKVSRILRSDEPERIRDQGCCPGGNPRSSGNNDEENRKRQRERGEGLGGNEACEISVHHVVHGVEEVPDAGRNSDPPDKHRDGFRGQRALVRHQASLLRR